MHWFLVVLASFLSLFHTHQTNYTRMVDRVSASIVRVTGEVDLSYFILNTQQFRDQSGHYVCSGEVVAPHRVLTAAHCTQGRHILVDGQPASIDLKNDHYDLALLDVQTTKPPITLRDEPITRFEPLAGIGYAFGWSQLTVLTVQAFLLNTPVESDSPPGLVVQTEYIGGMSGGPVVDQSGRMVSIIQRGNQGVGYGITAILIKAFLYEAEGLQ